MELPDCPPGAEGYQDSVTEVPKKIDSEETSACTKAEQEFQQHLNSLKIKTEDGSYRCMVERRGRDVSGKWIYLCYPCAAMCSGERILQTHISGKKHKTKLSIRSIWPLCIFNDHPYVSNSNSKSAATEKVLQKMAEEVEMFKKNPTDLDVKYDKYREIRCHIQETLDGVKAPLLGIEYLIEHPPEKAHYEPSYMCTLCSKQGHPRTIVNHLTCFWHRYNYILRHFTAACAALTPFRAQAKYREGVAIIMNRLAQRVQDKYGRLRPVHLDKDDYEKERDQIHQWIFRGHHFTEKDNCTFEEVVDVDLITSLDSTKTPGARSIREPSPPIVAAPSKPTFGSKRNTRRRGSMESLSDVSDEPEVRIIKEDRVYKGRGEPPRYDPYASRRRSSPRMDRAPTARAPNYLYKVKLADEKRAAAEEAARRARDYHEKNPEKHPLYPDEWRKFWNRRYKEIQTEGKDPSKYDFKPEWIVYWTGRMKELHDDELKTTVLEIYRKLRLTPPETSEGKRRSSERRKSPERRRPDERRRSDERLRTDEHRRSPDRRRSIDRRPPPALKRHSPSRRSQDYRRKTPDRRDRRSPVRGRSPRRRTPLRHLRTRSRSPVHKGSPRRRSPLSRRESAPRNHSPARNQPCMQTVLISDDELKPDDGLSPWNSEDSLGSLPEAKSPIRRSTSTSVSHASRRHDYQKQDFDAENVVATLRLLVALEDYLGSLGPKIVDLLAEALKMEKDKANSSEELLEKESALVLIETAKEKLKGAAQAGLVAGGAAAAVRAAVVRAAATLHAADTRQTKKKKAEAGQSSCAVPVAGVGEVDRAQIAQQMAAALVAQGKTDVSSEELAQLVEAVVGMAEAKKREAAESKKSEARAANDRTTRPQPASGNTSALKMLQCAYDDKKAEKEDNISDVMDGLSDSDLETLLKNFNELSAEEQHSLIAYLKKLEAREPQRVERLRQYVSAAATATLVDTEVKTEVKIQTVAIESDDDDYTVEDVFKSATQKVKEDQIRQEMEIVKKSLEETKDTNPTITSPPSTAGASLKNNISSATNLFALVQATLQSTPAPTPAISQVTSDVVMSSTQPRSFGDLPESVKPLLQLPLISSNKPTLFNQQSMSQNSSNEINSNVNQLNINKLHIPIWEQRQGSQPLLDRPNIQFENVDTKGVRGYQDNFNEGLRGSQNSFQENRNQDNNYYQREQQEKSNVASRGNYNQGQLSNYNQGSQGLQNNINQLPPSLLTNYNQLLQGDKYSPGSQGNFNQKSQADNFNQVSQGNYNQGSQGDNFSQGSQGNYNQGSQGDNFSQGSQGNYNQGSQGDNFSQGSQKKINQLSTGDNYSQSSQGNFNQGSTGDNYSQDSPGNYKQGSQAEHYSQIPQGENYSQVSQVNYNRGRGQGNLNQGSRENQNNFNQGGRPFDNNSGPRGLMDNYNSVRGAQNNSRGSNNSFNNQGSRGNFMGNNRTQDSFNIRNADQQNQQFNNNQKQNSFRGRGRGYGGQRGRGRGFY